MELFLWYANMNYTALQGVATDLVARFGRDVTLTTADGKRVRATAVMTNQTAADETGVNTSFSSQTSVSGKVALVSGKISVVPQVGDTLTVGTATYQVNNVEIVQPGTVALLYKLSVT